MTSQTPRPKPSTVRNYFFCLTYQYDQIWQKFTTFAKKIFDKCFKGLYDIWQSCEHTLGKFVCFWANFHCCKWPNIGKQFGHTAVTLPMWIRLGLQSLGIGFKSRLCTTLKFRSFFNFTNTCNLIFNLKIAVICFVDRKSWFKIWAAKWGKTMDIPKKMLFQTMLR